MFESEHFTLQLRQLKSDQSWRSGTEGISFLFLKAGAAKYASASGQHRLAPGDVLVVSSASGPDKLLPYNGAEITFWSFSLSLEQLYPLFAGPEIGLFETVVAGFKAAKLFPGSTPLARQCHRLLEDLPSEFNLNHRSQLLRFAATILTEEFKVAHGQRAGAHSIEAHMVQVFEKLSPADLLRLSVAELAAKFSCSRRHLNRLFHQYCGTSIAALKMEMRLLQAVSLLRDPNMKVIHVAERCGFNHLGLFNTCFKRRFGLTPGQWRKDALTRNQPPGPASSATDQCPLQPKGLCPWAGRAGIGFPVTAAALPPPHEQVSTARSAPQSPAPTAPPLSLPLPAADEFRRSDRARA